MEVNGGGQLVNSPDEPQVNTNTRLPRVPIQGTTLYDAPVYHHESIFKSPYLTVSIRCPDAWVYEEEEGSEGSQDIPVFGQNDLVGGSVILSPELSGRGKLNIKIEGSFVYISPTLPKPKDTNLPQPLVHEHVFFSGSMAIATYPPEVIEQPAPISRVKSRRPPQRARTRVLSLRDTFGFGFGSNLKKRFFNRGSKTVDSTARDTGPPQATLNLEARKSTGNIPDKLNTFPLSPIDRQPVISLTSSLQSEWQSHTFSFPLPAIENLEMPPSFSCSHIIDIAGIRGRAYAENAEVSYRLFVTWESMENDKRASIEAPFLFRPVQDDIPLTSQSVNGHTEKTETERTTSEWADFAFDPESDTRPPFGCMLTLPYPCSYPRTKSLQYYIFFATNSLYDFLSNDIRKESTIYVNLVRVVTIDGSAGIVEAVSPTPDMAPKALKTPIVGVVEIQPPNEHTEKRKRRNNLSLSLLQRVTTPILGRRRQPLSAVFPVVQPAPNPTPAIQEKPKYLEPEKKLPVLPQCEDALIMDTRIVARDVVVGFRKHPDQERSERELRKARRESSGGGGGRSSHGKGSGRQRALSESLKSTTTSVVHSESHHLNHTAITKQGGPQGMVHGKLNLDRDMIISVDWVGLSVEYFLEVEVKYGSDVLKCRAGVAINSDPA